MRDKNTEKLFNLLKENPDLRVIPMVHEDVASYDYSYMIGSFSHPKIDYIHIPDERTRQYLNEERIYFKTNDIGEITDEIFLHLEENNTRWTKAYTNERTDAEVADIEWEKVIVVNIETP